MPTPKRPGARKKYGGRVKGTPNKTSSLIKDALAQSFDDVGGVAYLNRMAEDEPKAYLGLIGKLIPAEIKATVNGDLELTVLSGIESPPGADS